ncbi:hypothetical protein [Actinoplanes sp. HUAS TT8]|uniref:hypothetical protein n=1 Tax=Actinoplanes sp. HUAS TT8 TaxID=3447453 RepID=UPI003F51C294
MLDDRIWTAGAHRVLHDDGTRLTLACWPGATTLAPTTWIEWLHTRDEATRLQGIPDLASRRWQLGEWIWQDTAVLTWVGLDPDFSLQRYLPITGGADHWKINFERPVRRTPHGIDTFDLLLDLIADPHTLAWQWKDQHEYDQARDLGVITDADHQRVEQARERAVAFVEARSGPLAQNWSDWRAPDHWPVPALPPHALKAGTP